MKLKIIFVLFAFAASFNALAEETQNLVNKTAVKKIETPPFFVEVLRAEVDNSKGATLSVTDEKSKVFGASIRIAAKSLATDREEVVLSISDKLPGVPEKPGDGMSLVQNSEVFAIQTTSGKVLKNVELTLPYYNEQEITADGHRIVFFHYFDVEANTFHTLESKPIKGRILFAKISTEKIYPKFEIVSLRLAHTPGYETSNLAFKAPIGWRLIPNSDSCLKINGPALISKPGEVPELYEATFSNICDYAIQASGCENKNGAKGCPLPKPISMPAHGNDLLKLTGFGAKDLANLGACREALADGTPVKFDVVQSSNAKSGTICLVEKKPAESKSEPEKKSN